MCLNVGSTPLISSPYNVDVCDHQYHPLSVFDMFDATHSHNTTWVIELDCTAGRGAKKDYQPLRCPAQLAWTYHGIWKSWAGTRSQLVQCPLQGDSSIAE